MHTMRIRLGSKARVLGSGSGVSKPVCPAACLLSGSRSSGLRGGEAQGEGPQKQGDLVGQNFISIVCLVCEKNHYK